MTEEQARVGFSPPDISEEEIAEVVAALRSGWLTTGPRVREFESEFATFCGAKHAVGLNSCTAALHLALLGCGIGPGDEVILPTMTFAATAEVVLAAGATPVLVDVEADTLCIDPEAVAAAVTEQTRALLPVDYGGQAAEMSSLGALAERHGLALIDDAAHAVWTTYGGRHVGSLARAACFSFYATKNLTTGEGGMLTTDDEELAGRVRMLSLHGLSRGAWRRYTAQGSWDYDIQRPGWKYNLTDIAAALGLAQLRRLPRMQERRAALVALYDRALGSIEEIEFLRDRNRGRHSHHLYVILLRLDRLSIDRARFIEELRTRGIAASVHFKPLHLHSLYVEGGAGRLQPVPVAEAIYPRLVSLPLSSAHREEDVDRVAQEVKEIVRRHRR